MENKTTNNKSSDFNIKTLLDSLPILPADRDEINRKLVHFLAGLYILSYAILPRTYAVVSMGIILGITLIVEFIRLTNPKINRFFTKLLKGQLRRNELTQPSGLVYTFSGAFLTMLLFKHTDIILTALSYQVFGDAMAALVGIQYGKTKIGKKSLEGSIACFITCLAFGLVFIFDYRIAFLGALAATFIELFPFPKPFDNFWLPFLSALTLKYLTKYLPPLPPL